MIARLFAKDYRRYLDLPVLGPLMDSYADWLFDRRYTRRSSQYEMRMAAHACRFLQSRGLRRLEDVEEHDLQACHEAFRLKFPKEAGSVLVLTRFLMDCGTVHPASPPEPSPKERHLNAFATHLRDERGYAPSTVKRQGEIASQFLDFLKVEKTVDPLASLAANDIERFVRHAGKRMGGVALQKIVSTIRNFLRFSVAIGVAPAGIENRVDAPRVYRQEKLPKALPWPTVQAFLRSIDRSTAIGKRDYAMFSLMTTYGLRSCDVVAVELDDVDWRRRRIGIGQAKTGNRFELPLVDEAASAIYDYLKAVPRYGDFRRIFLRLKAPGGVLKPTAVTEAFQAWSGKSGLGIPFKGAHCLRHSYALHLCRQGVPLKTIGDILGHRTSESTGNYIRLSTEDLREVALHVPGRRENGEEARP